MTALLLLLTLVIGSLVYLAALTLAERGYIFAGVTLAYVLGLIVGLGAL